MAPSSLSFQELKAQAYATKQSLREPGPSSIFNREKKDKKKTAWLKQNRDVNKRAMRDVELREAGVDRRTHEAMVANMEKKARQYDKLKRGLHGGLTDKQLAESTVDWDAKAEEHHYSSDSDDVDESLTVPKREDEDEDLADDPVIEYTDELGRQRTARRSEVPREFLPKDESDSDDGVVIENAHNHFPTYQPSEERIKAIDETLKEEDLEQHYDARNNVRDHGAAFYQFSGDAAQRARERAELDRLHADTQAARTQAGAVDIKPGLEGMQAEVGTKGKAMEKRKRELEERRKALQEKRRKIGGGAGAATQPDAPAAAADVKGKSRTDDDPFAALEAKLGSEPANRHMKDANTFLNDLAASMAHK